MVLIRDEVGSWVAYNKYINRERRSKLVQSECTHEFEREI